MRKHRVVAIGDSLTQALTSGAIHFREYPYPVIKAREMGLDDQESLYPQFHTRRWLPLNPGERVPETQGAPCRGGYHNLALSGFEVWAAYPPENHLLGKVSGSRFLVPGFRVPAARLELGSQRKHLFMVSGVPEGHERLLKRVMCGTALRPLNLGQASRLNYPTPISAAKQLAARWEDQKPQSRVRARTGPEMVTRLCLQQAGEKAFILPAGRRDCPSWKPDRFEKGSGGLADGAEAIGEDWVGGGKGAQREKNEEDLRWEGLLFWDLKVIRRSNGKWKLLRVATQRP